MKTAILTALVMSSFGVGFFAAVPSASAEVDMRTLMRRYETQKKNCERYADDLKRVKDNEIISKYSQYRACYPYMDEYTPFTKTLVDELMRLAFLADTTEDPQEAQQHLREYKDFFHTHMANIDILRAGYSLSVDNPRFGNPVFLRKVIKVMDGLLYQPGRPPARTPELAHYVISYGEEDYILNKIGGKLIKSEIFEVNSIYYNVHDIEDPKTGEIETHYFNITTPITVEKERKRINEYNRGPDVIRL